eukprot:m.64020 g.64020  ORF g.64020 m.64020 type:complete len:56 (-) comp9693_c0_seq1:130-297(-)
MRPSTAGVLLGERAFFTKDFFGGCGHAQWGWGGHFRDWAGPPRLLGTNQFNVWKG